MQTSHEKFDSVYDFNGARKLRLVPAESNRTDDVDEIVTGDAGATTITNNADITKPFTFQERKREFTVLSTGPSIVEIIKQKWSGVVESAGEDEFTVRLTDLTNPSLPQDLAVFYVDEIDDHQRKLIKPGALLYWHIGYRQGYKTPRERFSKIQFRRLPKWTAAEIKSAKEKAKQYANFFAADIDSNT